MKCSKVIALVMSLVLLFVMCQPVFAYSKEATKNIPSKTVKTGRYGVGDALSDTWDVGKEVWNGNMSGAARNATTIAVHRTVTAPLATAAATAVLSTVGAPAVVVTGGAALLSAGAGWCVKKVISWIW